MMDNLNNKFGNWDLHCQKKRNPAKRSPENEPDNIGRYKRENKNPYDDCVLLLLK